MSKDLRHSLWMKEFSKGSEQTLEALGQAAAPYNLLNGLNKNSPRSLPSINNGRKYLGTFYSHNINYTSPDLIYSKSSLNIVCRFCDFKRNNLKLVFL